jgi:hypothetical protein
LIGYSFFCRIALDGVCVNCKVVKSGRRSTGDIIKLKGGLYGKVGCYRVGYNVIVRSCRM